ncbi:hypothetical protein ACJMK2_032380 [Sinanodonta woodiana]|uniref:Uncharacterized protein n=1 Tax=Sinanodonta woodiana TaxID=1069815 RepID=A0ABD3X315_SINWO
MRDCLIFLFALVSGFPVDLKPTPFETTTVGCLHNDRWYGPGENIHYEQTGNLCSWLFCDNDGELVYADDWFGYIIISDFYCQETSTLSQSCFENGQSYALGEEISHGQRENYCYRMFCDPSGQIREENWNCTTTTLASAPDVNSTVGQ